MKAMDLLPNEVLLELLLFCPLLSIIGNISLINRRFASISHLILFPANKEEEGAKRIAIKSKRIVQVSLKSSKKSRKRKWPFNSDDDKNVKENIDETENGNKEQKDEEFKIVVKLKFDDSTLGIIPLPESAPPFEWKPRMGKLYFNITSACDYKKFPELINFVKFLIESGEMDGFFIELGDLCWDLTHFESGFASLFRGNILQFEVEDVGVDDHLYYYSSNENPFLIEFFQEIPQLVVQNHGGSVNAAMDYKWNRNNIIEWLLRPLPPSSKYHCLGGRKLFIYSNEVHYLAKLINKIILNFLQSWEPCSFEIWIFCDSKNDYTLADYLPKTNLGIHEITGEAFKITQIEKNDLSNFCNETMNTHWFNNKIHYTNWEEVFNIRRRPAEQIDEPSILFNHEDQCYLGI